MGGVPTASDSQLRVLGLKNLDDPLHVSYCRSQNGIDVQVEIGMVYLGRCAQGIQGEILLIEWHDLQELLAKTFFNHAGFLPWPSGKCACLQSRTSRS